MAPTFWSLISIHYLIYFVGNRSFLRLSNRVRASTPSGNSSAGPMAYLDKRCTGKSLFRFTPKTEFGHHGIRAEYALVADKYPDRPLSPVYRSGDKRTGGRLVAALPHVQKTEGLEPGYFLVRALANGGYNILDAKTGNVLKSTGPRTVEFVQQSRLKDYRSRMAAEFKLERTTKRELKHMLCYLRRTKPRPSQKSNSSSGDSKRQGTRT